MGCFSSTTPTCSPLGNLPHISYHMYDTFFQIFMFCSFISTSIIDYPVPIVCFRRSASNTDLKGFHTPHGGSASDLTELSYTTDRDSAGEGMGHLIAAAAALGPEDRETLTTAAATPAAVAAAAAGGAGLSVIPPKATSCPVMSLSGNLIGPGIRRGEGGGEVKKWARDAFMKEAVTWEDFSSFPQVRADQR